MIVSVLEQRSKESPRLTRRRRSLIVAVLVLLTVGALTVRWIKFNRDGLRHALHLQEVPDSVSIRRTAGESWTDYLFEADITLRSKDAGNLLRGRDFVRYDDDYQIGRITELWGTDLYQGFLVNEAWNWEGNPEDVPEGTYPGTCAVYFNEERDRAFVRYTSD